MSGANIWVLILVMCAVILVSCTEEETVDAENNKGGTSLPVHSLDEPFENASISANDSNAESEQSLEQDKDGFAVSNLPPSSYLPEIPRISVHDVKQKIETGVDILIVDTRGEKYYEKSHVIGAVSLTLADLNESSPDLNGYAEIITYCT